METIIFIVGAIIVFALIGSYNRTPKPKEETLPQPEIAPQNDSIKSLRHIFHHLEKTKDEALEMMTENRKIAEKNAHLAELNSLNTYRFDTHKERFALDMEKKMIDSDRKEALLEVREKMLHIQQKAMEFEFDRKAFNMIQSADIKKLELEKFKFQIVQMIYEKTRTLDSQKLLLEFKDNRFKFDQMQALIKEKENEMKQKYNHLKFLDKNNKDGAYTNHLQSEIDYLEYDKERINQKLNEYGYDDIDHFFSQNIERKMLN